MENKKSGFVLLDKPSGINSRTAGYKIASMFGNKKFGHVGTLDPMASGLLIIAVGHATKIIPYIKEDIKEYEFSIQWGLETDTGDITGTVINKNEFVPTNEIIQAACKKLTGEYDQVPPMYSAVHINGRRAYELARAGKSADIPARRVKIYELEIIEFPNKFRVKCGAGTYVRALARDIAEICGTVATCDSIRRIQTNGFSIKDSVRLDFMENLYNNGESSVSEYLKPIDFVLDDILVQSLDKTQSDLFIHGGFVPVKGDGLRRVYSDNFIGIGVIEDNLLKPKRII